MMVERVHTPLGSHIDPPLDESWHPFDKLRWKVAVVEHDGGLPPGLLTVYANGDDTYALSVRGGYSSGGYSFGALWTYLNGFSQGLRARGGIES